MTNTMAIPSVHKMYEEIQQANNILKFIRWIIVWIGSPALFSVLGLLITCGYVLLIDHVEFTHTKADVDEMKQKVNSLWYSAHPKKIHTYDTENDKNATEMEAN